MSNKIDIVINHSSADNASSGDGKAWVENFKDFLEAMLYQVLGENPSIVLLDEQADIVPQASIMVCVLSPNFIESDKCTAKIERWYQDIKNEQDSEIIRIFKVLKLPIEIQNQPPGLSTYIGYDLFYVEEETKEIKEFDEYFGHLAENNYWMKMVDLAYDVHKSLIQINSYSDYVGIRPLYERKSIYLAETGYDLVTERNIIKRELQRYGYRVFPDHTLPNNLEELNEVILEDLAQSSLSIHLIGGVYGEIPVGSDRSLVDLQNKLASEVKTKQGKENFSRLIWIAPGTARAEEKQKAFIDNIQRDLASSETTEVLQTPLEDFKTAIHEQLDESNKPKKSLRQLAKTDQRNSVYILYDQADKKDAAKFASHLEGLGYTTVHPDFEGGVLELRELHIDKLRKFDFALIYQGSVNERWVKMKVLDLLKAPGFGRQKPVLGKILVTTKSGHNEEVLEGHGVKVFEGAGKDTMEGISGYLKDVRVI